MEPNQGGIKTWQWVVTAIVIIVIIVIAIMVFGNKGAQAPGTTDQNVATDTNASNGTVNRVVMTDQYPGNVVYLSSVQLDKPGWVAIHKDNAGKPGDIIGEAYFGAGINPGSKVTLRTPLVDGATYYAMLHSDDGDKAFDATKDLPLTDSNGNVIMKVFHASSSVENTLKG